MTPTRTLLVWGWAVRAAHWALAACVLTCLWRHEGGAWHENLGYAALALTAARIVAGFSARTNHLRFRHFVCPPAQTIAYARALRRGAEVRHLGHNPLGGWMIAALLGCALVAGASGAVYATDRFWGDATVLAIHQFSGWSFALLVPLHVGGVVLTSMAQRENLVRAMLTGHKRVPGPGDIGLD